MSQPKLNLPHKVWLVGKGKSADNYDWDKANPYRFAINEAAYNTPKCFGAFAKDYNVLDSYAKNLSPLITLFRKSTHVAYTHPNMYVWNPKELKYSQQFTSTVAVQVLHNLGVRIIHFVGFDSMKGDYTYSDKYTDLLTTERRKLVYQNHVSQLKEVINGLGIVAVWEH